MAKQRVDIVYLVIHKRFMDESDKQNMITRKKAGTIIGRTFHIYRRLWPLVLKELEMLDLIQLNGRSSILVKPSKIDINNCGELYKRLELF